MYKHSFPIVRYFNGILFVFTLVFLKCAHYSTDFGTRMIYSSSGAQIVSEGGGKQQYEFLFSISITTHAEQPPFKTECAAHFLEVDDEEPYYEFTSYCDPHQPPSEILFPRSNTSSSY